MADKKLKNSKEKDVDDFDFDFGEFDTAPPPPPKGRDAVKAAATGIFKGIKQSVINPANIERTVRDALPEGYGEAKDFYDASKYNIQNTWRDAVETLKPLESQLKSLNEKIIPKIEGFAPEKILAQLRKFTNERTSSSSGPTRDDENEEILAQLFGQQNTAEDEREKRSNKRGDLEQGLAQLRHQDISSFLAQISDSTNRLAQYQDNVAVNYHRTSLRIAMQHYGVAADSLALARQSHAETQDKLAKIIHNSSLPDFQKSRLTEAAQQQARDSLIEGARNAIIGDTAGYINRFFEHSGKKIRDSLKTFTSAAGAGLSMGGMMLEDDPFGPQESGVASAGRTVGNFLGGKGMQYASKLAKNTIGKNKKVHGVGAEAAFRTMNAGADFHDFMKKKSDGTLGGDLRAFLGKVFAPDMVGNFKIDSDSIASLNQPRAFSGADSKALREVIPGYLSAILQQITMQRTGQDAPRQVYDYSTGTFKTDKQMKNKIVNDLFGNSRQGARDSAEQIINSVDRGGRLSGEDREKAIKALIANTIDGKNTNIASLAQAENWGGGESGENIANVFSRFIRTDKNGNRLMTEGNVRRQIYVTGGVNQMASGIGNPAQQIQELVKAGYREQLVELGVIDQTGVINRDKLKELVSMNDSDYLENFNYSRESRAAKTTSGFEEAMALARKHKLDEKGKGLLTSMKTGIADRFNGVAANKEAIIAQAAAALKSVKEQALDLVDAAKGKIKDQDVRDRVDSIRKAIASAKDSEEVQRLKETLDSVVSRATGAGASIKDASIGAVAAMGYAPKQQAPEIGTGGEEIVAADAGYAMPDIGAGIRETQAQARAPTSKMEDFVSNSRESLATMKEVMLDVVRENSRSMRELFGVSEGQTVDRQGSQSSGNTTSDVRMIHDTLLRIEEILKGTHSVTSSLTETMATTNTVQMKALLDPPERNVEVTKTKNGDGFIMNVRTSLAGKSYTSLMEHAIDSAKETAKKVGGSIRDFANRHKAKFTSGLNFVKGIGQRIKGSALYGVARAINSMASVVGDVYVGAELSPRLTVGGIKAGAYIDKNSNKTIESLSDITGDVVDHDGNVLLSDDDIMDAYIGGTVRQNLRDIIKGGLKTIRSIKDLARRFIPRAVNNAIDMAKSVVNTVKQMLPPYDVYVDGAGGEPVLFASKFRLGMYYSKESRKVLRHPRDIDGPVVDRDGNYVVSQEQYEMGLIDVNGAPIGSPVARMFGKAGALVNRGLGFLKTLGRGAMNLAGTVLGGLKEYFKEIFTPFSEVIANSKKSLDVLTNIYNLLDDRLPGGNKVLGDMNGDGIRDGSIEDIRRKKAAKEEEEKAKENAGGPNSHSFTNSIFGRMAAFFTGGGMFGGGKKKKDDDDDDDDSGWSLGDAADAAILAGEGADAAKSAKDALKARKAAKAAKAAQAASKAGKVGKLGRIGRFLGFGRAGRALGAIGNVAKSGAGMAGRAAMAVAPGAASTIGKVAGMAGRHGLATLGRAGSILGGAGRLGAGAIRGGAALAGGAGRLLGSVGLRTLAGRGALAAGAGLAAGALGGGALGTVGAVAGAVLGWPATLASVGIWAAWKGYKYLKSTKLEQMSKLRIIQYGFDPSNEDLVSNILKFEDMIAPKVKISDDGKINFDPKDIDMDDVAEVFGVDTKLGIDRFNEWYHTRFRPVLAANLLSLNEINKESGKSIALTNAAKLETPEKLKLVTKATANMENAHNFMRGPSPTMPVTMQDSHVKNEVKRLMVEFDKEQKDKGKPELSASSAIATTAAMVGGDISSKEAIERFKSNQQLYKVVGKDGKEITGSDQEKLNALSAGAATLQATMIVPENLVYSEKGRVDALSAVRFKSYGLKTMEADKVKTLRQLEQICEKSLFIDGKNVRIRASIDDIMQLAGTNFGQVELSSQKAQEWRYWFNLRFTPAYLKYVTIATTLAKTTSMDVARTVLTPQDQVEVANHVVATMTTSSTGSRCRIWDVLNEAWPGYELASNPDITITNIEALKELAKKVILGEVNTQTTTDEKGNLRTTDFKRAVDTQSDNKGLREGKMNTMFNQYSSNKEGKGLMASGDTIVENSAAIKTSGEKALAGNAAPVEFTKLPASGGDGWAANKQLILAAAKAAGVNPKLLASIIGIESGFKPNSLNKTTNASGLGNFLPRTWQYITEKYGAKYGITPKTSVFDARANALMTAEYIRENNAIIKNKLGRDMTTLDAYMSHFLGGGGLSSFLKAGKDSIGAEVNPSAAGSNPNIFFNNAKTRTGPRKVGEIIDLFSRKMDGILPQFAIAEHEFGEMTEFASASGSAAESVAGGAGFTPATGADPSAMAGQPSSGGFRQVSSRVQSQGGYGGGGYGGSGGTSTNAPQMYSQQPGQGAPGLQDVTGRAVPSPMYNSSFDNKLNAAQLASMPKGTLKVTLQREDSKPHGTFGIMTFEDGTKFHTMELAWLENKARESCIPAGQYIAKRRPSPKFGMPYEVMNVPGRSAILIHAGSYGGSKAAGMRADSAGCILLGMRRDEKAAQPRIHDTRAAMELFNRITGNATIVLTILPSKGQMNASVQSAVDNQTSSAPAVSSGGSSEAPSAAPAAAPAPTASSGISAAASATSFAPSATAQMGADPGTNTGYGRSATNIAERAAQRVKSPDPAISQSSEEIRANTRNNVNTAIVEGITKVNELLTKLVDGQVVAAGHLEAIANNTKGQLEVSTAAAKVKPEVVDGNSRGSMPPQAKPQSKELKPNPVPMARIY